MNLDNIPQNKTSNFSIGISEVEYDTEAEVRAFLHGLAYADDLDVEAGTLFLRNDKYVVRVRVGDFDVT